MYIVVQIWRFRQIYVYRDGEIGVKSMGVQRLRFINGDTGDYIYIYEINVQIYIELFRYICVYKYKDIEMQILRWWSYSRQRYLKRDIQVYMDIYDINVYRVLFFIGFQYTRCKTCQKG